MSSFVLIDTSSWTQALRRTGDPAVRARVGRLLSDETAVWCDAVRLELWNGVRGAAERDRLKDMEATLPSLSITDEVWDLSCELAAKARGSGLTTPATDLLIFACASFHGVSLEHSDQHFDLLAGL